MKNRLFLSALMLFSLFHSALRCDNKLNVYGLPILMYSPETKLAGGAMGNLLWRNKNSITSPNFLMLSGIYSQNKQSSIQLITDIYWKDGKYYTHTFSDISRFPASFFGIGNNTSDQDEESYTPLNFEIQLMLKRDFFKNCFAAIRIEYLDMKMDKTESGGMLDSGVIYGSEAGITSATGFIVGYDSRDNLLYTTSGTFANVSYLVFDRALGSDYDYSQLNAELRKFTRLSDNGALGLHLYYEALYGEVPFYKLAKLGGLERMRGYFEGRFRDKHYLTCQMEYRIMPIFWRLGVSLFAAAGQVSAEPNEISLTETKFCGGAGIRYLLNKEEKFNIRLDLGFGKNSSGIYLSASEAF